jgi:competence protein ComEA
MRVWLRRIHALVSSAVFAPVLAKLGAATVFLTVLGLVGRGVFDPLGLAPGAARAAPASHIGSELIALRGASSTTNRTAPAAAPSADAGPTSTAGGAASMCPARSEDASPRVILNVAGEEELIKLPGVGPKMARAILALRDKVGRFKRVEELYRVRGIKRRFLERVRPHLVLDAADCDRSDGTASKPPR